MGLNVQPGGNNIYELHVSGILTKAELDAMQATASMLLTGNTKIKALIVANDFAGWEKGADWGDMSFFVKFGDKIEKIAIVSNPKWETEWLMFVGAGFRRAPVKFFPTGQTDAARTWLNAS
jgi:hypothetical protein